MGHVRAVLWHHLHSHAPGLARPPQGDPNALLPADAYLPALHDLEAHGGPGALREAGASYARLWARTFRSLVRHIRGHPEHALRLWATEVYPYLRGDRLAARAQKVGPGRYEILVHDDLPREYVAGMLEAFVALSHAQADATGAGGGRFVLQVHLRPRERFVRLAYLSAQLRIPLLVTAVLAALVGTSAARAEGLHWLGVVVVLWGAAAAQSGANAFHDISVRRSPLTAPGPTRGWLLFQMLGSYAVAAAAMAWIALSHPGIVVYGAVGLGLGLLYRRLRDVGGGPVIAVLSHGPLTVWGSHHALTGSHLFMEPVGLLLALPTGLLAGCILYLDDLADRPLDEAAGKRTLVVRLPRRRHAVAFAVLLATALAALAAAVAVHTVALLAPVVLLSGAAAVLVVVVRRHLDEPHRLAPARMGTVALYVASVATLVTAMLGAHA